MGSGQVHRSFKKKRKKTKITAKCLGLQTGMSVRTVKLLSHVQCILKFGTYVLGVKAFLVDGVICVESNHEGIPCRVDFFQRLQESKEDSTEWSNLQDK